MSQRRASLSSSHAIRIGLNHSLRANAKGIRVVKHKYLSLVLFAGLLAACSPQPSATEEDKKSGPDIGSTETIVIGGNKYAFPTGGDSYQQVGDGWVNWGIDPAVWVSAMGSTPDGLPQQFEITGRTDIASQSVTDIFSKHGLKSVEYGEGNAYQTADPIGIYPPIYLFDANLEGFVECSTASSKGISPDFDRCAIHILDRGAHHRFTVNRSQISEPSMVARRFLEMLSDGGS